MVHGQGKMNTNNRERRRAGSNYFQLDSDRKRMNSAHHNRDSFSRSLTIMDVCNPRTNEVQNQRLGGGMQGDFDDEVSIDFCCDVLYNKFGFQSGSVDNQREHVLLLLANGKARSRKSDKKGQHVEDLHRKLISNYVEWCKFLRIKMVSYQGILQGDLKSTLHMEIMLYLLIWGEAANLRHMPECVCYLYHQMMKMLNRDIHGQERHPEGWFLKRVVRPVWEEASNMKRKNSLDKHLEHVRVRNYDDINEYFWKRHCVNIDITKIGSELTKKHGKTYYEHRSIFTLVLNYYRIFQFNFMFLIGLIVLSFAVAISPGGGMTGLAQFQSIGQVVQPYTQRDLKLALVSLVFSHAAMAFLKCVLEAAHGWHLLVARESLSTSSRSFTYGGALIVRMLWNGFFAGIFGLMIYHPFTLQRDTPLLENATTAAFAFLTPGTLVLLVHAFAPQAIVGSFASKFIREGETCYVGRHMAPPLSGQLRYILFWLTLWSLKAVVSYVILVRPLMLPSLAIYSMNLNYSSTVVSFHNIGLIMSLWMPVVFIFNYDTQIYFTAFQALLGGLMGLRMKTGEIHGIKNLTKAFRMAPQFFDQKVVTRLARSNDANGGSESYQSQMMLRFVVVWNEVVNSFREGDLVDDKEAAILQYDIQSSGDVFEPVFLSAGKIAETIKHIKKLLNEGKGDSQLQVFIVENDSLSAARSFYAACMYVLEALLGSDDADLLEALRSIEHTASRGEFMRAFDVRNLELLRAVTMEFLEAVMDLPDPEVKSSHLSNSKVHTMGVVKNFVGRVENLFNGLRAFCGNKPGISSRLGSCKFLSSTNGFVYATRGLVNLYHNDTAMGAATRAYLLMSLDKSDAMPRCAEAQRRLGFFLKSLMMEIPQLHSIKEMRSFSVVTPFYSESVLFSIDELNNPLDNHPIFKKVEEDGKNITILKYLITIHPEEWENFLERVDVASVEEAQQNYPLEIRLWASYRGQTLARTVQGMMLYEDAIKILHWLEIGSSPGKTAEQKQAQLEDMVRLKFSYICACQVYGKHRAEGKQQADDIDYLLKTYPNLRVAYVDSITADGSTTFNTVLIKSENGEIAEVYRYELPGDPILGEGKPENQNNALPFTRGEFVQTIDMNQQHYFEECLKMPQFLATASLHPSKKPVSIIGMREHIFTGNASSLSKFKSWQELVFVTLSQRVLANPLYCRMHYGHPDVFDKVIALSRGGVSKASKGINLSEDVFAGFNSTLRGGIVTHVEFMQCGKGRDVALSQISMFEGKLANGAGETCLAREAHRMGQFMDFFRLNSTYYSHTGFYFATWMTIVTTYVYMYSKVYLALSGVQQEMIFEMNSTAIIRSNVQYGFDERVFDDVDAVVNTQFYIQAGTFLMLPLMCVYFGEGGLVRGMGRFIEMLITCGPAFFVFQVGTTMHYFDSNILHGGAKYQATGRGFKITRETFVLMYKSYANSHYRKAFELVGLCLVFLTFGDFFICQKDAPIGDDRFAHEFCSTAQGYGVQTFSTWFIAVLWLLSPFIFNTDGLDWEKTKVDVKAWANWMFVDEDYKDEDKNNSGGWIAWWKGDLEQLHNSNMIARFTVLLRESRHFLLMFYVVTLKHDINMIVWVLAANGATILFLGFVVHGFGLGMKSVKPTNRAAIYLICVLIVVSGYVVGAMVVLHYNFSQMISLFFGYVAGLYGFNETIRMWSFKSSSIATITIFQQLAFLFDFIFCVSLIIPLFIMSGIPFLNVIQTRMMYNEGFSKVMSASSQYAFSVAAFTGILGGTGVGWLFSILSTLESSPSFVSFVTTYEGVLDGDVGDGKTSYIFYGATVVGTIASGFLTFFAGRRLSIVVGGLLTNLGMVAVCAKDDFRKMLLVPGLGVLGCAIGILLPSLTIYIFEISTRDIRGKAVLLLGIGFVLGSLLSAFFSSVNQIGWIWQVFIASIIISITTPAVNIFPESPYWVLERKGWDACEACLVILRRKPDVSDELKAIREEEAGDDTAGGTSFKFLLGVFMILVSSLSTSVLTTFMSNKTTSFATDQDRMLLNCTVLQLVGAFISFFFIDKLDHKSILFGTLIPVALCVGILGFNEQQPFLVGDNASLYINMIGLVLYFFLGLGTTSVLWTACVGMFTTKGRAVTTTFLFALYFAAPSGYITLRAYQQSTNREFFYLYALAGCCMVTMVLLLGAGTKNNGVVCTKHEMETERSRLRRMRSNRRSLRTPGSARSRNLSRTRTKSTVSRNYQAFESPVRHRRQRNVA